MQSKPNILFRWCLAAVLFPCHIFAVSDSISKSSMIYNPADGVYVAAADYSFYNFKEYSHTSQDSHSYKIKKTLDLSKLDQSVWDKIEAAAVDVFMYAQDDGKFNIVVNGHSNNFPTQGLESRGWGWYNCQLPFNWFSFSIGKNQLVRGENEIVISPSQSGERNSQLFVGIDMFESQGRSFRSADGGKNWVSRPLCFKNEFSGEYMVRLSLYLDKSLIGKKAFSHEDFPALPAIDICPPVKNIGIGDISKDVSFKDSNEQDVFENGTMRLIVQHGKGFAVSSIYHKGMNIDALKQGPIGLFTLELNGHKLTGTDFDVAGRSILLNSRSKVVVAYDLVHNQAQVTGRVRITMDKSSELKAVLSIRNDSETKRLVKAAFPVLGGIGWSEKFDKDYYLYPYATGIILDKPAEYLSAYGCGTTYFQQMTSYCPEMGGGIYLRANDQSGEYKILHFYKQNAGQDKPTFKINPVLVDTWHGRANAELILFEPFEFKAGTSMAFSYFGRELEGGEQWIFASSIIGVVNGDWRQAMDAYRAWFESFSHKVPHPNKLTDCYAMCSTGVEWGYRGPCAKYNTEPNQWGHKALGHVAPDFLNKPLDVLEHSGYWEHDEITDNYIEEMKAIAAKASKEFILWPDRHGNLEGKNVLWGNQGDYGLRGYNERWGGLVTFREYLNAIRAKGFTPTLYVNISEAALNSVMGRKYGLDWCTEFPEGNYFWPYYMWEMCVDNPGWREYMAQTCARLIEETGADGIRIDEMGGANRICCSQKHSHTFGRSGHYAELQAQADMARQVRIGMDKIAPQSILTTESEGLDLIGQYLNGSLSYYITNYTYSGHVANKWEGFVALNINRFFFPRHKIFDYQFKERSPQWRFFNATGAVNREWSYRKHEYTILKDNSDAFETLDPEPMISTFAPMVYTNQFSAENKVVFTVYNATQKDFVGELLSVVTKPDYHFVDLYNYRKLKIENKGGNTNVSLELSPRSAGCIAYLPELMNVTVGAKDLRVNLKKDVTDPFVKLVDLDGKIISECQVKARQCTLTLPVAEGESPKNFGPFICKLYSGKYVIDAVTIMRK